MSSIFIPNDNNILPYTKTESNRRFERRDADIVKLGGTSTGPSGNVIYTNGSTWGITGVSNNLASGTQNNDYLLWNTITSQWSVQNSSRVRLGYLAGSFQQSTGSVAIGYQTGQNNQGTNSVAIGTNCSQNSQGIQSVSIGVDCTPSSQGYNSVAIGSGNCLTGQGNNSIAIGTGVCNEGFQDHNCIAIGNQAGYYGQKGRNIAIGPYAGYSGFGGQATGQIHISAVPIISPKNQQDALYIEPIRVSSVGNPLLYNSTGEIVVNTSSERYKTNILDLPASTSEKLYQMKPKIFDRLNGETLGEYGLIAEQLAEIDQSLVVLDKEMKPDGIHFFRLLPMIIQEMKSLKTRIDVLESQLPAGSPELVRS